MDSKPTLRPSALPLLAPAKSAAASTLFKSRALKPVHLNQVGDKASNNINESYAAEGNDLEEEKPMNEKKNATKHRKEKKIKYETKYGYQSIRSYQEVSSKCYLHKQDSVPQTKRIVKCIRGPDVGPTRSTEDLLFTPNIKPKVSLPTLISKQDTDREQAPTEGFAHSIQSSATPNHQEQDYDVKA